MAPRKAAQLFDHIELGANPVAQPRQDEIADNETSASKLADTLSDKIFKKDVLDRKLERHHITGNRDRSAFEVIWKSNNWAGIAFSAAVGVGVVQTSNEIIALGGPVGAIIAYIFAGLVIVSVLRCVAEMVSVRPVKGPLMDFPNTFVDQALGFTVGIMYW